MPRQNRDRTNTNCMAKRIKCVGMHIKQLKLRSNMTKAKKEHNGHNALIRVLIASVFLSLRVLVFVLRTSYAFVGIKIPD